MTSNHQMTDRSVRRTEDLDKLAFWENGLLPVVTQSVDTGEVLMVAFANREALERSLSTGQMHYWSRSRGELWHKGATSGNYQDMISLHADCDSDTLLARVRARGPACHTGEATCFGRISTRGDDQDGSESPSESLEDGAAGRPLAGAGYPDHTLPKLWQTMVDRAADRPPDSYTVRLLDDENLRLKKLGEETAELVAALARGESARVAEEGADLVYHLLAALLAAGVTFQQLLMELEKRRG